MKNIFFCGLLLISLFHVGLGQDTNLLMTAESKLMSPQALSGNTRLDFFPTLNIDASFEKAGDIVKKEKGLQGDPYVFSISVTAKGVVSADWKIAKKDTKSSSFINSDISMITFRVWPKFFITALNRIPSWLPLV